jgi:putrescine transport system ATP-binding protein
LARSLAKAPTLLLLDEPLGALDKKLRQETQFELMDIQEKTGTTFVIVTHDQEEAMTVASRIAVMDHGQVMQVATPDRLYEYPNSRYVAEFIGEVNLIEGTSTPGSDPESYHIAWAEGQKPLIGSSAVQLASGSGVCMAIRPEKVHVSAEEPTDRVNRVRGHVHDIAYLGNISTYHVRLADGTIIKAQTANTRRINRRPFTWEDQVWLSWSGTAGVILTK